MSIGSMDILKAAADRRTGDQNRKYQETRFSGKNVAHMRRNSDNQIGVIYMTEACFKFGRAWSTISFEAPPQTFTFPYSTQSGHTFPNLWIRRCNVILSFKSFMTTIASTFS